MAFGKHGLKRRLEQQIEQQQESSHLTSIDRSDEASHFDNPEAEENDTYKKGKDIVKYFLNHIHAHAIFRTQSNLDLLKVAKTQFASHHLLLTRLASCREALATTVVLRAWKDWVKRGDENARAMGAKVIETIADDTFWDEVDILLSITKSIFLMIKFADGKGPKMEILMKKWIV
ncbi:hypothetical protein Cgig2_028542 [Carnegiea gigantea]|uniref:Uncharacterized protein n=1 Tax=Carnegiea gigantea TaxID=171969 RepID=A0A9Q1JWQ7_9CARY|nr:hypothetical protein Cgig2_028542 [Carnegiea gigantea]